MTSVSTCLIVRSNWKSHLEVWSLTCLDFFFFDSDFSDLEWKVILKHWSFPHREDSPLPMHTLTAIQFTNKNASRPVMNEQEWQKVLSSHILHCRSWHFAVRSKHTQQEQLTWALRSWYSYVEGEVMYQCLTSRS